MCDGAYWFGCLGPKVIEAKAKAECQDKDADNDKG
jgi:hypothetical protein